MDKKSDWRKSKSNSSAQLLAVLIGFCILAIIEILYGQAQIRMEKERLALEKESNQAVQELRAEWSNLAGNPDVGTEQIDEVGTEQENTSDFEKTLTNTDTGDEPASDSVSEPVEENVNPESVSEERKYDMQIVCMGDSLLDHDREDNGVAMLIGNACNAKIYNMAIGGTTAALLPDEQYSYDNWTSTGLLGVVNAIIGNISPDVFDGYRAGEILRECDFSQTDYFIIEYGVNDFLCQQVYRIRYLESGDVLAVDETHTYVGALQNAINLLQDNFPDAKVLLISPHYCQVFAGDIFVGDAYSLDFGYGTLIDFYNLTGYVASEYEKTNFIYYDAIKYSGIDAYTADDYLKDGIHLTAAGRQVYADYASRLIKADFYREE